jgi:hypothetical protein
MLFDLAMLAFLAAGMVFLFGLLWVCDWLAR